MATYVVDANHGNDANSGVDAANAWKHIQYAIRQPLNPGDTIYLRGANPITEGGIFDETHNGQFNAYGGSIDFDASVDSGTSGHPITMTGYPGDSMPVIDGEFVYPDYGWIPGVASDGRVKVTQPLLYFVQPDEVSWWTFDGIAITRSRGWAIGSRQDARETSAPNVGITIRNCKIYNCRGSAIRCEYETKANCVITGGDYWTVNDNQFYECENYREHDDSVLWSPTVNLGAVDHVEVKRNLLYNSYGEGLALAGEVVDISDNIIHDTYNAAILIDHCQDTVCERNVIWQTGTLAIAGKRGDGIKIAGQRGDRYSCETNNVQVVNNLVIGCESSFSFAVYHTDAGVNNDAKNVLVAHNTFVNPVKMSGAPRGNVYIHSYMDPTNVHIENNICVCDTSYGVQAAGTPAGVDFDYNCWYPAASRPGGSWEGSHDVYDDPDFADADAYDGPLDAAPTIADYYLLATSPCINYGNAALGITEDYREYPRDAAPDIGFYEYGAAPPELGDVTISAIAKSDDPIYINICPVPNTVTISADITATAGIASAWVGYVPPGGGIATQAMTNVGGDTYEATLGPFASVGTLQYYIAALDNDGNYGGTATYDVVVLGCSVLPPDVCTEACYCLEFDTAGDRVDFGSDPTLDDLPNADFTAEAWIKPDGYGTGGNYGIILEKGSGVGWRLQLNATRGLQARADCATTDALSRSGLDEFSIDGNWHHVVAFWDMSAKLFYLAVDGTWVTSYDTQTAGVGAYATDSAADLYIGYNVTNGESFQGQIGLTRISSSERYPVGVNFTPPDRFTVFTDDADTEGIWICDNTGATVYDCSSNANDGAVTGAVWALTGCPSMEPEPGEETETPDLGSHAAPPLTYSLTLMPSFISETGSVVSQDITDLARDWTRSIRLQGGFWTGSFTVQGKRIFDAFDTWLGSHIQERSGGMVTWAGLIYEMELRSGGFVYRTSLDDMWNAVRTNYYDPNWTGLNETGWATNAASIARFGRKEYQFDINTISTAEAEAARDMFLGEYGWPWPKITGVCPMGPDELHVTVNGYCFLLSWKYLSGGECWMPGWEDCGLLDAAPWFDADECDQNTPACDFHRAYMDTPSIIDLGYNSTIVIDTPIAGDWVLQSIGSTDKPIPEDLSAFETPQASVIPGDINTYARYMAAWRNTADGIESWAYCGDVETITAANDGLHLYTTPDLATQGINGAQVNGDNDYYIFHTGTDRWLQRIMDVDWAAVFGLVNIQENRIIVQRHNNNRADIGGERAWEAIMRAVSLGDYDGNPWRAWVGVGRQFNYEPISTEPVVYVLDGTWRSSPEASPLNPWQLKPGVGKVLNYRFSPPRTGYWLEDPALFLMEEVTVDSQGNITPSMADISQTENLLTWLASLPSGGGGGGGGDRGPVPPNWNVEANRPNELGPGGDTHGYWTVQNGQYVWVHDDSINLTSWWNPQGGRVEG